MLAVPLAPARRAGSSTSRAGTTKALRAHSPPGGTPTARFPPDPPFPSPGGRSAPTAKVQPAPGSGALRALTFNRRATLTAPAPRRPAQARGAKPASRALPHHRQPRTATAQQPHTWSSPNVIRASRFTARRHHLAKTGGCRPPEAPRTGRDPARPTSRHASQAGGLPPPETPDRPRPPARIRSAPRYTGVLRVVRTTMTST
jgi:hypothetical protein